METNIYSSKNSSLILSLEEIKEKIDRDFYSFDFLIFSISPKYSCDEINYLIKRVFKTENFLAFHAISAFKNDKIVEDGIVTAVIKFEREGKVDIFYKEDIRNFEKDRTVLETAEYLNKNRDSFHIIFAGLSEEKFAPFLENLSENINYTPVNNIIGGISSGKKMDEEIKTYQFINDKIIKNGFAILSFSNVYSAIDVSLGFKPYGITYEIKRAEGAKLFTVDEGRSFAKIAKGFLKGIQNPDIRYLWYLPINILDEEDGYVATMRTIEEVKKDYVKFFGPIKKGQRFKVSFATKDELLKEDEKCAKNIYKMLKHIDIAFNFSCIARQYILEDRQKDEAVIYNSILNSHLFGFFTFGEIGPDKRFKKLKLYNETSLIVALREK